MTLLMLAMLLSPGKVAAYLALAMKVKMLPISLPDIRALIVVLTLVVKTTPVAPETTSVALAVTTTPVALDTTASPDGDGYDSILLRINVLLRIVCTEEKTPVIAES